VLAVITTPYRRHVLYKVVCPRILCAVHYFEGVLHIKLPDSVWDEEVEGVEAESPPDIYRYICMCAYTHVHKYT
jgi:hypothetical protein